MLTSDFLDYRHHPDILAHQSISRNDLKIRLVHLLEATRRIIIALCIVARAHVIFDFGPESVFLAGLGLSLGH